MTFKSLLQGSQCDLLSKYYSCNISGPFILLFVLHVVISYYISTLITSNLKVETIGIPSD